MRFEFMTRDIWDALILGIIIIGLALTALRLYSDFTRPTDGDNDDNDTLPTPTERQ